MSIVSLHKDHYYVAYAVINILIVFQISMHYSDLHHIRPSHKMIYVSRYFSNVKFTPDSIICEKLYSYINELFLKKKRYKIHSDVK